MRKYTKTKQSIIELHRIGKSIEEISNITKVLKEKVQQNIETIIRQDIERNDVKGVHPCLLIEFESLHKNK